MTETNPLRDNFGRQSFAPPPLDPRMASLVRLLARAIAASDYETLLRTGAQPNRREETETI